ncbi:MAG: hypothetical protein ACREJ3_02315 [Polyangiaceae bacterium]
MKNVSTKRTVDPEKIGSALRKMTRGDLLIVLDRALVHVPKHRLHEVVDGFIAFDALVAVNGKGRTRVIDKVRAFDHASRRGDYYESFNVNSKNFMEKSEATEEWIAECERLLGDVLGLAANGDPTEVRQALELLFALLRRIDEGEDDIVFFADEGGSWQVDADWPKVLPAYFRCLSSTAAPAEYAELVNAIVKDFARHDAPKFMSRARGAATREQKAALARVVGEQKARR